MTERYRHVVELVREQPWAILPSVLATIRDVVGYRAQGGRMSEEEIEARVQAARAGYDDRRMGGRQSGPVAVLPLYGIICQRAGLITDYSGGTSTQDFTQCFRQAMGDESVSTIVIDVDSPGGGVYGVEELAAEIFRARGVKRVVAVANCLAASAAYWIACQADELVIAPSGEVGSIGVFCAHEDVSKLEELQGVKTTLISAGKYKVEGNPYEPLSEEARAAMQVQVDAYYDLFVKAVARGRGVGPAKVRGGFGEGRTVLGKAAVTEGMADRVATLDETVARLAGKRVGGARATAYVPELMADVLGQHECIFVPGKMVEGYSSPNPIVTKTMLCIICGEPQATDAVVEPAVEAPPVVEPSPQPNQNPEPERQPDPADDGSRDRARLGLALLALELEGH